MYSLIKQFLFTLSPEKAHYFTTNNLRRALKIGPVSKLIQNQYQINDKRLERKLFGLTFKNPVGLAAGFDKNAELVHEFAALGFGFIEVGTVTPLAQPGNPKPRLFRLVEDQALINRMGFNNKGMLVAKENLEHRPRGIVVGGNIGKNKVTPNTEASSDYLKCFETLFPVVDYFVINVSSPNTPDLRQLQDKEPLMALIKDLQKANQKKAKPKPVLLKIAPDLNESQIDDILEIADVTKLDGIIATNTTISREGLKTPKNRLEGIGAGGLSGAPLLHSSTHIIQYIRSINRTIPIIAVGGIMSANDALKKFEAGANLIQIYSGLVYKGPALIKEINQAILKKA